MSNKKDKNQKQGFQVVKSGKHNKKHTNSVVPNTDSRYEDIFSSSSTSNRKRYRKKKHGVLGKISDWWAKRKTWQKASMITAVSLLLVICSVFGVLRIVFDYNYNKITNKPEDLGFENIIDKDIVNIALFGIDTRDTNSFKGNSDSIMILSLNANTKQVKIISVMRDTLVPITYNGKTTYGKINSAYAKGGPELAIKTLNKVFNLDISEYATVNFFGMVDIIDAVGGIEAELTKKETAKLDGTLHHINGCIQEICSKLKVDPTPHYIYTPGVKHLNGIQAVAYSRIRYVANIWGTNNDYGRTDRQRYVMEQLFNKALTLEKSQYVKLAKSLIPCSETSLNVSQILGLAFDILLESPTFMQARIPHEEFLMRQPSGYGSVVYFDLDFAAKLIHEFIYNNISFEDYISENGIEKNDWYAKIFGASSGKPNNSQSNNKDDDVVSKPEPDDNTSSDEENNDDTTSSDITSSEDDTSSDETTSDNTSSDDTSSEDETDEPEDDGDSEPQDSSEEQNSSIV